MNVAEERAEALRREVPDWPLSAADRQALRKRLETRWRSNGPMVSLVFFGLTLVAVAALFGLLALLDMPKGWITAAICIATAEYLIRRAHLMGSGVESGLWLGGLCAWVFALPSEGRPEGILLIAATFALSGLRVRNPFLGAVAAALVLSYLGVRGFHATALVAGVLIALLSLLALLRTWQRPSTETLFIVLLVVAPISGAAWSIASTPVQWALAYIGLGCAELAVGARRRDRGALYGGAVAMGIAALVLREWFDVPLEWKLIGAGVILFALSAAISRRLRGRQSGFVMTAVRDPREGATVILSSVFAPQGQAGPESHSGGGGDFGGAGSSATF